MSTLYDRNKIHGLIKYGSSSLNIKRAIKNGVDVHAKNDFKMNAFHCAVYFNREDLFELLFAMKVDINAKDDEGQTALDYMYESMESIIKYLQDHGAKRGNEIK